MTTPPGGARPLTAGEAALARSVFHDSVDLRRVEIRRRKWAFFQPRAVAMAPCGHLHFHPQSSNWTEDFAGEGPGARGLFLHELCHVWQWQRGVYLPLARHPFCRYSYTMKPGWRLARYGLEQQAEIVRHAYLLREGHSVPGAPPLSAYESLLGIFR
ncbi:vgr related protein [Sphingomonas sp. KR1UV-12]|uniref:Vgr related protein n=1 Tax=Sphingomonas aurea TaxID=3063994 RepID=A0ABT9EG57_9SPHN|nr:vgr related protein [Sphingomonas sp. KR1UV-12]MDP1025756.1 vgr related protein [Sphingomonas sp. KR1UV-12]